MRTGHQENLPAWAEAAEQVLLSGAKYSGVKGVYDGVLRRDKFFLNISYSFKDAATAASRLLLADKNIIAVIVQNKLEFSFVI